MPENLREHIRRKEWDAGFAYRGGLLRIENESEDFQNGFIAYCNIGNPLLNREDDSEAARIGYGGLREQIRRPDA